METPTQENQNVTPINSDPNKDEDKELRSEIWHAFKDDFFNYLVQYGVTPGEEYKKAAQAIFMKWVVGDTEDEVMRRTLKLISDYQAFLNKEKVEPTKERVEYYKSLFMLRVTNFDLLFSEARARLLTLEKELKNE